MKLFSLSLLTCFVGTVWAVDSNPLPAPKDIKWGSSGPLLFNIDDLTLQGTDNQIVINAFNRTLTTIKNEKWYPQAIEKELSSYVPFPTATANAKRSFDYDLQYVRVHISDPNADLQHDINEDYVLNIQEGVRYIDIFSITIWGIINAFSTFEQIIIYNDSNNYFYIEQPVSISDSPDFKFRGVMIDTSRNFYSIDSLKRTIDSMYLCKLNVLQLHLTDTQSWPIFIDSYPEMIKDAYSSKEVYTADDIKGIISYAKERGVRIVPELDTPGHSSSGWKQVDPEIIACSNAFWSEAAVEPGPGQLEILNPNTYEILDNVYKELSSLFTDNFFHVGFDELNVNCYNYSNLTQAWFKENSSRSYNDLAQYLVDKSLPIFNNVTNRRLIMWEDSVTSADFASISLPKDVILQSWDIFSTNKVKNLTSKGYDVIVSSNDFLYLDCGSGGFVTNDYRYDVISDGADVFNYGGIGGSWCAPYKTWQRMYDFEFQSNLTEDEKKHIIGGSALLWSEQSDSNSIDNKLWPRLSAWAENLWSGNKDQNGNNRVTQMTQRILNFRERLVSRGVAAVPLVPKYCLKNPHACDLTTDQTAVSPQYVYSSAAV